MKTTTQVAIGTTIGVLIGGALLLLIGAMTTMYAADQAKELVEDKVEEVKPKVAKVVK